MWQSEDNQHFDDQMKDRLEHAEFSPPSDLWEKIEEDLPPALPVFLRFRRPTIAAIWAFAIMSSIFIYQKFDYAYKVQNFLTASLEENENPGNPNDLQIFGLNLTAVANFAQYQKQLQQKKLLAAGKQPLESTLEVVEQFSNGRYSYSNAPINDADTDESPISHVQTASFFSFASSQTIHLPEKKLKKALTGNNPSAQSSNSSSKFSSTHTNTSTSSASTLVNLVENIVDEAVRQMTKQSTVDLDPIIVCEIADDEASPYQYDAQKKKVKPRKNLQRNKGFYIGPTMGTHYTAMTLSSPEGINTSKMEQTATFGTFYGISTGYILNNRWSFGMEWIYNSSEGQRFEGEFKGKQTRKYVDLDYFKIPIYAKYRHQFLPNRRKVTTSFNYLAGLHYSKLKNTNTFVNGEIENFQINKNVHQWGMMLGAELDIYPTERIFVSLGVRGTFNADVNNLPTLRGDNNTDPFSVQTAVYAKIHYVFTKGK